MNEEEKKRIEREEQYTDFYKDLCNKQQKEIEKIKDKNKALEGLLQGNLFELYLYYKELASKYQANSISKDKIREKIKAFQDVKKEIIKNENKLLRASITYDIVRNDYCEKMLQELLEDGDHIPRID